MIKIGGCGHVRCGACSAGFRWHEAALIAPCCGVHVSRRFPLVHMCCEVAPPPPVRVALVAAQAAVCTVLGPAWLVREASCAALAGLKGARHHAARAYQRKRELAERQQVLRARFGPDVCIAT